MDDLYHQTNKLVQEMQAGLSRVERAAATDLPHVEAEIQARIDVIISNCERLEILVNKEPPTRRVNAKLRVDQLKYDCQHLQSALRSIMHRRFQREEEQKARDALLSTEFAPNDSNTSILIDQELQHHQRMTDANREMDIMLDSGGNILGHLKEQRVTLKGAHKKILDVANSLGLSNTVLRLIERRTYQDKFILFGGMIVSCILMWLIWRYFS